MADNRGRRRRLRDRLEEAQVKALDVCAIPRCLRIPARRQGNGLSPTLCRYHAEFLRRHGSAHTRSLTGGQLRPYIRAAERVLGFNAEEPSVRSCLRTITDELESAGLEIPVGDLRTASAERKARGVFARLRERNIEPTRILAVVIGSLAGVEENYARPGPLWDAVCVGKALKRRASGSHTVYGPGSRWDYYPESRGAYLATLGRRAIHLCAQVTRLYRDEVLALKIEKYGAIPMPTRPSPFPRSRFGNERIGPPPVAGIERPPPTASEPSGMSADELERYAEELKADVGRRGAKAFDGKF